MQFNLQFKEEIVILLEMCNIHHTFMNYRFKECMHSELLEMQLKEEIQR